jgi:hypothetical protein
LFFSFYSGEASFELLVFRVQLLHRIDEHVGKITGVYGQNIQQPIPNGLELVRMHHFRHDILNFLSDEAGEMAVARRPVLFLVLIADGPQESGGEEGQGS